jgi:hypothetical protein
MLPAGRDAAGNLRFVDRQAAPDDADRGNHLADLTAACKTEGQRRFARPRMTTL